MTETERLDLLAFVRADRAKAISIDRLNRLAQPRVPVFRAVK
jgi:hypothetical protein